MNTKQLALRLAALDYAQRASLLAELPIEKQDELKALIREVQPLIDSEPSAFDAVMAEMDTLTGDDSHRVYDENALSVLLSSEGAAVKRQLVDVFSHGRIELITPHVRGIIEEYLLDKSEDLPPVYRAPRTAKSWWRIWS